MKNATMLYRSPGPLVFEGVSCETQIVEEDAVEAELAAGWNRTWHGAESNAKERDAAALSANEEAQARVAAELAAAEADAKGEAPKKKR